MPSLNDTPRSGQEYWRSLNEIADTPEFRESVFREFPAGALDMIDSSERRHFLKIMGASMALAGIGLAGCRRWPESKIAPYAKRPEGHIPGVSVDYASALDFHGDPLGLLVKSVDGRPIKIEGNPAHPLSRGATHAFAQAEILDLYDPDRARAVQTPGSSGGWTASSWDAFDAEAGPLFEGYRSANGGQGLYILASASSSPTRRRLQDQFRATFPNAVWLEYESLANDMVLDGAEMAFGRPGRPVYNLTDAMSILSLDADFLHVFPESVRLGREFAAHRSPAGPTDPMSRMCVVEPTLSVTGSNADDRIAVRHSQVGLVAAAIAYRVLDGAAAAAVKPAAEAAASAGLVDQALLDKVVEHLTSHRGQAVVIAGQSQPAEVHYLAHLMNEALGASGGLVQLAPADETPRHLASIRRLASDLDADRVKTLVMMDVNPVYDAPADLDLAARLAKAETVIGLNAYVNESATPQGRPIQWMLPAAHPLETWGDVKAWNGDRTIAQPLILPLFDGRSQIELLAFMLDLPERSGLDLVRATYATELPTEDDWRTALHDGVIPGSSTVRTMAPSPARASAAVRQMVDRAAASTGVELVFIPCNTILDGRYANNGWLQELPDPVTKLTWDNALLISPAMAESLGVEPSSLVRVRKGEAVLQVPVIVQPGVADDAAIIALGYGRTMDARILTGSGVNAGVMRTSTNFAAVPGCSVEATGESYPLATTQDHHIIDLDSVGGKSIQNRLPSLVREADLPEYQEDPSFAKHRTHVTHRLSMWEPPAYDGEYQWGMSIDLGKCTGCSACVIACQAENNIPIVGKDQVLMGREMHWLRIDRYYRFEKTGEGDWDVNQLRSVAMQPMTCLHCENAPCEQVCPVAATVHDDEGVNVMVYNRCVGTRYCSNNCPYKVRRFNYFDYHRREPLRSTGPLQVQPDYYTKQQAGAEPLRRMQFNPEVTVRMRGVMEKCSYCTQRVAEAKIAAKNEWVKQSPEAKAADTRAALEDGAVKTACQQACPTDAIVFGDLLDKQSRVAALHKHKRSYEILEELHTKPRTRYVAKVRNPSFPQMEEGGHGHGGHGDNHSADHSGDHGDDHGH